MAAVVMPEAQTQRSVAVLMAGDAERFLIDTCALLRRDFPADGPALDQAAVRLRARFGAAASEVLRDMFALLGAMRLTGRLPRLRLGRARSAGKDETFFIAMLAALQADDKGRAIEAAIALLDTAQVHDVVHAARALAKGLAKQGLPLRPMGAAIFDYLAGYESAQEPPLVADTLAGAARPRRPVLRLLKTA